MDWIFRLLVALFSKAGPEADPWGQPHEVASFPGVEPFGPM